MSDFENKVNEMMTGIDSVVKALPKEIKRLKKEMTKEDAEKFAEVLKDADLQGKINEYEQEKKELLKKI